MQEQVSSKEERQAMYNSVIKEYCMSHRIRLARGNYDNALDISFPKYLKLSSTLKYVSFGPYITKKVSTPASFTVLAMLQCKPFISKPRYNC